MSNGFAALQAQIARVKSLEGFAKDVAPDVAVALEVELQRQISAGVGPDGQPWKLTRDGAVPLRGAAKDLRAAAVGTTVIATLSGPEALHHKGRARGGVQRQILPSKWIPAPAVRAIKAVLETKFNERMGAGGG